MIVLYTWVRPAPTTTGFIPRGRYHYLTDRRELEAVCGHQVRPWDIISTDPPGYGSYPVEFDLCDDCMKVQARADIDLVNFLMKGSHEWRQVHIGSPHRKLEVVLSEEGYAQFQAAMARLRNLFDDHEA